MTTTTPSVKRYSLNTKQLQLLKRLYKFRFATTALLAAYKGTNQTGVNKALKRLYAQGYVDRLYDSSYRIKGKEAIYFLAPKSIKLLGSKPHSLNKQVLHAMYKNKLLKSSFVEHNLDVFRAYLELRDSYPAVFDIYTKSELGDFDYFPRPLPDLYLNRAEHKDNLINEYLIILCSDLRVFIPIRQLQRYERHWQSGAWEEDGKTEYPVIVLVCPDAPFKTKLERYIANNLMSDHLQLRTTTLEALLDLKSSKEKIWTNPFEADEPLSLDALSES